MRNRIAYSNEIKKFLIDNSLLYTPKEMVEQIQFNFEKKPSAKSILAFYERNNINFKGKRNKKFFATKEFQKFVEKRVQLFSLPEICRMIEIKFGVKLARQTLANYCNKHNYNIKIKHRKYPEEMKKLIKNTYGVTDTLFLIDEIYRRFGIKLSMEQLYHYACINGITKEKKIYPQKVKRFMKKHAMDYTTSEMIKKVKEEFDANIEVHTLYNFYYDNGINFKKIIHKAKIGDEENTNIDEPRIKIGENKWQRKKRYIWEKYYKKKLKTGESIIFLDGDKDNYSIDNLILIKNGIHQKMAKDGLFIKLSPEAKELQMQIIELRKAIAKGKKDGKKQKK